MCLDEINIMLGEVLSKPGLSFSARRVFGCEDLEKHREEDRAMLCKDQITEYNVRSTVIGQVQGIGEYSTQLRPGLSGQEAHHRGSGTQDER